MLVEMGGEHVEVTSTHTVVFATPEYVGAAL